MDAIGPLRNELSNTDIAVKLKTVHPLDALIDLFEETCDYIRVNHLGDPLHNQTMKNAYLSIYQATGKYANIGKNPKNRLNVRARNPNYQLLKACEFALEAIQQEKFLQAQRGESVAVSLGMADQKLRDALNGATNRAEKGDQ